MKSEEHENIRKTWKWSKFVVISVTHVFSLSSCSLLAFFLLPSRSLALCSRPIALFPLSVQMARSVGRELKFFFFFFFYEI